MHRRQLLKMAAFSPLGALAPSTREVRRGLIIFGTSPVQIIVTAHPGAKAAERFRRSWIKQGPFETIGEWYSDAGETRPLPDHLSDLPGTLRYYTVLFGEGAEQQTHLVGSFRRDHISYIVRVQDGAESITIAIADFFAAQLIPGYFEITWKQIHLESLIPASADLNMEIEEHDGFWP